MRAEGSLPAISSWPIHVALAASHSWATVTAVRTGVLELEGGVGWGEMVEGGGVNYAG